ncbi:1,2-phenylacetyl-CoA epoxidase subunit PaaE [Natronorarus salvus]|uniref:1,2-phenylacetyl-CoA epoxidase subunit PaaE n=1 Tax=Natronorarus salvus TaxID=3117733 RepID=UPI002F26B3BA
MRGLDPSVDVADDGPAECPYCGSTETEREHPKGPSLCRSMHFCHGCEQPFERFE